MKMFKYLSMLVLCTQMISANEWENINWLEKAQPSSMCPRNERACIARGSVATSCQQIYDLGTAGRGGGPTFFLEFGLPGFGNFVTISTNRNLGSTQGDIELTERGLKINKAGNYAVSYEVILSQTVGDNVIVPTFLILNDTIDPNNVMTLIASTESVLALDNGEGGFNEVLTAIQADGILQNVPAGTTLSIVACNGQTDPNTTIPVTLEAWFISATRITPSSN